MPDDKKRAEALRDNLLDTIRQKVRYWATLPDFDKATGRTLTVEDRCDGVAFSILADLDGCGALPAFDLVARVGGKRVVISDMLHEQYEARKR